MSAAVAAPTAVAPALTKLFGKWSVNLKKSELISPFLAEMGVPWAIRKLADNMGATWEMKALEGGGNGMAQTVTNTFRTSTNVFKVDEEVEVEQPDGSKQRQTLSVVSETAVQIKSSGPDGRTIVSTMTVAADGTHITATLVVTRKDGTTVTVRRHLDRTA